MSSRMMRAREPKDAGIAMVAILASFTIVMVVVLGSLAFLVNSTKYSRFEQDVDLALAAAEAGIADLLTELRIDPEYFETIAATKDTDAGYCRKDATGGPEAEGDVFAGLCGWDAAEAVGWQQLGGAEGGSRQEYHYAVTEAPGTTQYLQVVSTGRSRDVYRSVRASIARETAQQWVYFKNYGISDPNDPVVYGKTTIYGDNMTSVICGGGWAKGVNIPYDWEVYPYVPTSGVKREYIDASLNPKGCSQGYATADNPYDGPVHANDTIYGWDAVFTGVEGGFTTAYPECKKAVPDNPATWQNCVKGTATFPNGIAPQWRERLDLASVGNAKLTSVNGLGCRYTGPTRIRLEGDRMTVWSRQTQASDERQDCGTVEALRSTEGALVPLPEAGFVFVDAAPEVAPVEIAAGAIGGGLPLGDCDPAVPPTTATATCQGEIAMSAKDKRDGLGNVWVEGHMTGGNLTIAADRTIVITGDLTTDNDEADLLGLLAGDAIEIFSPVMQTVRAAKSDSGLVWDTANAEATTWAPGWNFPSTHVLNIEAALYAASSALRVQNSNVRGLQGTMKIVGSLAENFGGITSSFDSKTGIAHSGYLQELSYNKRLKSARPLLFPPLGNGAWTVTWREKADTIEAVKD
ncbi:MAG: hypothetical protein LBK95_15125 [Bifidobacteriaceae bacterium]|nr:hypothetical protein [Bifidobacteriaceae bacterium]